jgi:hypothetical protein
MEDQMNDIFQIPAVLNKYESKANGSVKFIFTTTEKLPGQMLTTIMEFLDNCGWLNFAVRKIEAQDIVKLPEIDPVMFDEKKSPSERLRNTIFCYFCQKKGVDKNGKKPPKFDSEFREYYLKAMDNIINAYKEKLT